MKKIILLFAALTILIFRDQAQTVIDYDGNVYDTVIIGTTVWMKQNLKVTHYNNGTPIPNITDNTAWSSLTTGARCYFNNDSAAYDSVYGAIYNWYVIIDTNNICPTGWHVSTNAEWQTTETYLGGINVAGGKMKEADTLHWTNPNSGATNSSGFTGLPGGLRDVSGNFLYKHENGLWWTATAYSASKAWGTYLWYLNTAVDHNAVSKTYGLNIRCIKDNNTGLEDFNKIEKLKLYPNPANDKITIDFTKNDNINLVVYNTIGEIVMLRKLTKGTTEINIRSLVTGAYFIKITGDDFTLQLKLIKE